MRVQDLLTEALRGRHRPRGRGAHRAPRGQPALGGERADHQRRDARPEPRGDRDGRGRGRHRRRHRRGRPRRRAEVAAAGRGRGGRGPVRLAGRRADTVRRRRRRRARTTSTPSRRPTSVETLADRGRRPRPGVRAGRGRRPPALRLRRAHRRDGLPGQQHRAAPPRRRPGGPARAERQERGPRPVRVGRVSRPGRSPTWTSTRSTPRSRTRLGWARRTVELPPGRYETLLPPGTVADLMIYASWTASARDAEDGSNVYAAGDGRTRIGERLTPLPVDPALRPGLAGRGDAALRGEHDVAPTGRPSPSTRACAVEQVRWLDDGVLTELVRNRGHGGGDRASPRPRRRTTWSWTRAARRRWTR